MLLEAVDRPILYRFKDGREVVLRPGGPPVELPDVQAKDLLERAAGQVRIATVVLEAASPTARPVYWQDAIGRILGPAQPEFLAQVGPGLPRTDFWVVVAWEGLPRWIRADRLRNKQAFDTQSPVRMVEPVRELR